MSSANGSASKRTAGQNSPEPPAATVESRTVDAYRDLLLGGKPTMSAHDVAFRLGVDVSEVERYWLDMGFPMGDLDQVQFNDSDLEALRYWSTTLGEVGVSAATTASLTTAQSHLADRLALWEMEALVEDAEQRYRLDDSSARVVAIDEMKEVTAALEAQLIYAWRRQMFSLIERMTAELSQRDHTHSKKRFPLSRALGFVDMQSYTATSTLLGGQMVGLVERFEYVCRSAVNASGGRVVKMIGDSVFFIGDDLESGLNVVSNLMETLNNADGLLPVRASFVYGDVFSRSGDVFGPPVNLAARLVDVAPTGRILTDAPTAAAIASSHLRTDYRVEDFPSTELRGFGRVSPYLVSRTTRT